MKTKIDLDALSEMTFADYQKKFKKEIKRAQAFGKMNCVVLGEFEFACGHVGTIMVLGTYSGKLTKFYKQMKRERKGKKDFAVGTTVFEKNEDGTTTLHVGLTDGMAKPNKLKKHSRKLFKKVGMNIEFVKGELTEEEASIVSEEEREAINKEGEELSDDKKIGNIYRKYTKAFKDIVNVVVPNLKENKVADPDFDRVRQLNVFAKALMDEFETLSEKKQEKWKERIEAAKAQMPKAKAIYAKVKLALSKQNNAGDQEITLDELLKKCHDDVDALSELYVAVQKETETEKGMPVERSVLKEALQIYQQHISDCENQIQEYSDSKSEEDLTELKNELQQHSAQAKEAEEELNEFERIRKEEIEKAEILNQQKGIIDTLDKHIKKALDLKKDEKYLLAYEDILIKELLETIKLWNDSFDGFIERVQYHFKEDKSYFEKRKEELKTIQSSYTLNEHPSGKDQKFKGLIELDQSQSIEELLEASEKLDDFFTKQEILQEKFSNPVSMDVKHYVQGAGTTDCKKISTKMLNEYLKTKKGVKMNDYGIAGFGDTSSYYSIVKEDKTKKEEIIKKDGRIYESLDNDALIEQEDSPTAFQYILDNLDAEIPLVVGVDHTYNRVPPSQRDAKGTKNSHKGVDGYNSDKTTDHFITIVGKGMDKGVPYFEYLDPASSKKGGDKKSNRLYATYDNDMMVWFDPDSPMSSKTYVLSAVCKFKKDR